MGVVTYCGQLGNYHQASTACHLACHLNMTVVSHIHTFMSPFALMKFCNEVRSYDVPALLGYFEWL